MANKFINLQIVSGIIVALFYDIIITPRTIVLGASTSMALIITIWFAFTSTPRTSMLFGFAMGLLIGFARPWELGWLSILLSMVAFLFSSLKDRLVMESTWLRVIGLLGAAIIFNFLYYLFSRYGLLTTNSSYVFMNSILSAIYTTLLGIIVFNFIKHRRLIRDLFQ